MEDAINITRQACNETHGAWVYLKNRAYVPFIFSTDPILSRIDKKCNELGCCHSSASFASCMRQMKHEADKK